MDPTREAPRPEGRDPTISVVICAYTTARWTQLRAAVQSVLAQQPPPYEVIVVIDYCPDLEDLARRGFPAWGVQVVTNTSTRGLSGARNTGTDLARGDVVAFLDDDAVALPGWLAGHARNYTDPGVVGVGGLVIPEWESHAPRWFPDEFGWVVGCSYLGQPDTAAPVRNPIGANMSFRRPVLLAAGGFAPSLGRLGTRPTGCEETELSIRATTVHPGTRIMHEPDAPVQHQVPLNRSTWSYFRRRCWAEGRSKARVSALATQRQALSSERAYVQRTLPRGVGRNLLGVGRTGDLAHLLRASAICAGLAITAAGYGTGQLGQFLTPRTASASQRTKVLAS